MLRTFVQFASDPHPSSLTSRRKFTLRRGEERRAKVVAMAPICSLGAASMQLRSLGSLSGELAGSGAQSLRPLPPSPISAAPSSSSAPLLVQPLASRKCDLTGKKANNGYRVSFSHHRTKHLQGANLQYKRLWWEEANRFVKMRISTRALKTIEKKGLSAMAKEAGIDLLDYAV